MAMKRALVSHRIHRKAGDDGISQTWGQLMGSPISFPILCLVNLAVSRLAMDLGGYFGPYDLSGCRDQSFGYPMRPLVQYPLLVNGDDVGFESDQVIYGLWKDLTKRVGLVFSLGKNFTHPTVLILNSRLHVLDRHVDFFARVSYRLWPLRHLEVGLLYGSMKGGSREIGEQAPGIRDLLTDVRALSHMAHELVGGWSLEQKERLLRTFFRHWRPALDRLPAGCSWFLPNQLGGMGFPFTRIPTVSEGQLRLAAYLSTHLCFRDCIRPLWFSPEKPAYLSCYERAILGSMEGIEVKLVAGPSDNLPSRFIESFAPLGVIDPVERQGSTEGIRRRFEGAWRTAMSTSLKPMGVLKALGFSDTYSYQGVRWC